MMPRARWAQMKESAPLLAKGRRRGRSRHSIGARATSLASAVVAAAVLLVGVLRQSRYEVVAHGDRAHPHAAAATAGLKPTALESAGIGMPSPRRGARCSDVTPGPATRSTLTVACTRGTLATRAIARPVEVATARGYDATAPPHLPS
ncbi:MAG: hypothetical protein ABIP93_09130 [Gemmatimonadaceae bacterium]